MTEGSRLIDVWCVDIRQAASREASLSSTLDAEERDRASRFVRPVDALRYRIVHGALRMILSQRTGVPPTCLSFARGEHGKPRLWDEGPGFSLTHSGALALVAVSDDRDVGIDVELVRPVPAAAALAHAFFSPEEAKAIAEEEPRRGRDLRFLRSWTALEALLKARGTGFAVDATVAASLEDDPPWSVRPLALAPAHTGAIATRGDDFAVRMWSFP